jgi:UDP-glucose 4-epimerase
MHHPGCVAITGLDTDLGRRLVERLLANPMGIRVIGLDVKDPQRFAETFCFYRVDLTESSAGARLVEIFRKEQVDTVLHLAFHDPAGAGDSASSDHELEAFGSFQIMNACAESGVRRLVVRSTTMCYGSHLENPSLLGEDRVLTGQSGAHRIADRVEVDRSLGHFAREHQETEVTTLRHCWVMGPAHRDRVVRYFERPIVATVLGFDPLLQFVHEDDLLDVFETAVLESHPGVFNVVGEGVLPLSGYLALAGKTNIPLPESLLRSSLGEVLRMAPSPLSRREAGSHFFAYLKYSWIASGARLVHEFGRPLYSSQEAWTAMVSSRRMEKYR